MLKPQSYSEAQILLENAPYEPVIEDARSTHPGYGGVLARGQVVWSRKAELVPRPSPHATVFVDQLGVVSLDARALIRADVLNARRRRHN